MMSLVGASAGRAVMPWTVPRNASANSDRSERFLMSPTWRLHSVAERFILTARFISDAPLCPEDTVT